MTDADEPDGIGVTIEWLRSRYLFRPGSPTPFLPAERKLIDRAKRLLMDQQKLTEPAAYASLRKRAMNQGVKLAEVAREVVASAGLLK